jgi:hypothetical protein
LIEHTISPAGDPFYAKGGDDEECFYCGGSGFHFITFEDEDGEEREASYRCHRCSSRGRAEG